MWQKIENNFTGRKPMDTPRISKSDSGPATLRVPEHVHRGAERASIYSDGNGKIAVQFNAEGEFSAFKVSRTGRGVTIPNRFKAGLPNGTHELPETFDNGMLVIDLKALGAGS